MNPGIKDKISIDNDCVIPSETRNLLSSRLTFKRSLKPQP